MKKNISVLLLILLVLSLLCGCKKSGKSIGKDPSLANDESSQAGIISSSVKAATDDMTAPAAKLDENELYTKKNPLTGQLCPDEISNSRPVAMMINNIHQAIPQLGISGADIIYECIVEGSITRLMAVFSEYKNIPETGSVRSSRDYFIDLAQAHDAIYVHCGGSPDAYTAIKDRKIDNLDGVNGNVPNLFWKDQQRLKTMGYEHASVTNGKNLEAAIKLRNFRTVLSNGFNSPLFFYDKDTAISGSSAKNMKIAYSAYVNSLFEYDEKEKLYKKSQSFNGKDFQPHIDGNTNETLKFKNVIVLIASYSSIVGDEKGRLNLNFTGSGNGFLVTDGLFKKIVWKKSDRQSPYALYEEDGKTKLLLNPGKSYIGITPSIKDITIS